MRKQLSILAFFHQQPFIYAQHLSFKWVLIGNFSIAIMTAFERKYRVVPIGSIHTDPKAKANFFHGYFAS